MKIDQATDLARRPADDAAIQKLVGQGVSPVMARLFAARGVSDIADVRPSPSRLLPIDLLMNARAMGELLATLQQTQARIVVVSDYDCDGATAGSVLIKAFEAAGLNSSWLVPHRIQHSYGLTPAIVEQAAALEPRPEFIITVDSGISSKEGVARARELGMEVLVTDHHLPPDDPAKIPDARLIVNPQQAGCTFPSKAIAGCGVAWYVACAMHDAIIAAGRDPGFEPQSLLPYVALGTVADMVALDLNNRILVETGLELIRQSKCSPGIKALANVSGCAHETLTCLDIGFSLAPRLNAAGRLAHMEVGIECLTTDSQARALELATELAATNEERKEVQRAMDAQAQGMLRALDEVGANERSSVVVHQPGWHEGVVGIVAGRVKDARHRPTFVLCDAHDGNHKGSGRSIEGFHLKHALDAINATHPGLLLRFGGHAMAAGVTIARGRLAEFTHAFEALCAASLTADMLSKRVLHDGAIPLDQLTPALVRDIGRAVWGQGFPHPLFVDHFKVESARSMGSERQHLKLRVSKGGRDNFDVVAWGQGDQADRVPPYVEVAYTPSLNQWKGNVSVQIVASRVARGDRALAESRTSATSAARFGGRRTGQPVDDVTPRVNAALGAIEQATAPRRPVFGRR